MHRPRRTSRAVAAVIGAGLAAAAFAAARAAPEKPAIEAQAGQLDALRAQCVAAARIVQQKERTLGALDLAIQVMRQGVAAKDQEIAQSRQRQEALLGALERLARAPREPLAFAPEGPVDRLRSGILIAAALPALTAEAHELGGQLAALAAVRTQIDTRRKDVDDLRNALAKARGTLDQLVGRRNTLIGQLLHDDAGKIADGTKADGAKPDGTKADGVKPDGVSIGDSASDLFDLIKRADLATDQRDKQLLMRLRVLYGAAAKGSPALADPTRPKNLRALDAPHAEMVWPVSGELVHRFGEADRSGRPSQGLTLVSTPEALVVAPFDGRVEYVGRFRDYGLILIIRHAGGYHSLLAGLGRVDVAMGQWLLAGEPVGSLPEADDSADTRFYLELRREGRPVDPQSRLGSRDQKIEDTRVSE